jgi:hypothetical protein
MNIKIKSLIALMILGLVDVIVPIPIVTLILIYVVIQKPPWFMDVCRGIYNQGKGSGEL